LEVIDDDQHQLEQFNNPLDKNQDFVKIKNSLDWDVNSDYNSRRQLFGLNNYTVYDENIRRLEEHAKLIWPIIAPGIPTQNAGFNINFSTSKILLGEMRNGEYFLILISRYR